MVRRRTSAVLATVASLAFAAPAMADPTVYFVDGTAETPVGACGPSTVQSYLRCDTLRAAVNAANANAGDDLIYLQAPGVYRVSTALNLTDDVALFGRGARTTTLSGAGTDRVLTVAGPASAFISRLTITGGNAGGGNGGNILSSGDLVVTNAHITAGRASSGGGIASVAPGSLVVDNSLIESNHAVGAGLGGGILSQGPSSDLEVVNSTIAFNAAEGEISDGGGIASTGASNTTYLAQVTIAHNSVRSNNNAAGLYIGATDENFQMTGVALADNLNSLSGANQNCELHTVPRDDSSNAEDGSSCQFEIPHGATVSATLQNRGGDTDVLPITATSTLKNLVNPCLTGTDQRGATRNASDGACDAGAFEEGVPDPPYVDGGFDEPPPVAQATPTPVPTASPTPVPTATPTPAPTPVPNKTVVVKPTEGTVLICTAPGVKCKPITSGQAISVGSTLDLKKGTIELTSIPKPGAPLENATFKGAIVKVTQSKGITNLTMTEPLAPCAKKGTAKAAAKKKPKSRRLFGSGKGAFRTTGRYSAATIRGTSWNITDSCTGTTVRVKKGVVSVFDKVRNKTKVVRTGHKYVARPKK